MRTQLQAQLRHEEIPDPDPERQAEGPAPSFLSSWANAQAPWWGVSSALHFLALLLIGLVTVAVKEDQPLIEVIYSPVDRPPLQVAEKPKPSTLRDLEERPRIAETDPDATEPGKVAVSPELLALAEWGNKYVTNNPDRPDTDSAYGIESGTMMHDPYGIHEEPGGGGLQGDTSLAGIGLGGSPGSGGGAFGGEGTGLGNGRGPGRGTIGSRDGVGRRIMVKRHKGSPATESAVEAALRWLAYHQEADGHWDAVKFASAQKTDTACTGFALLAFLGCGHTERTGSYKENVRKAVAWLKSKQQPSGLLFDGTDAGGHRGVGYPHAIAGMALAEAAGMAKLPETAAAAQRALDYSCEQHQQGEGSEKGGWRYAAKSVPDLSVSGWYVMQLKSAKVSGLRVNPASFEGAIRYLDTVEVKAQAGETYGGHRYAYQPGRSPTHRVTAIGCLSRQFLGWKREDLQGGVEWFVQQGGVPQWGANGAGVDLYYWYYGTLCAFQQQGEVWKRWNEALKRSLVENQRKGGDEDGSWDPAGAFSGEWGRVGQTALGCLCLEVYYRYLPMYKD